MSKQVQRFGQHPPARQRGAIALFSALTILFIITAITIGAVNVGVGEQRSAANEVRTREAMAIAEAGIERGMAYLRQHRDLIQGTGTGGWMAPADRKWTACAGTETAPPCGDGVQNVFDARWTAYPNVPNLLAADTVSQGDFVLHYVARVESAGSHMPGNGVYYVIAEGRPEDQIGGVLVRRATAFYPFLARRPDAPLVAQGGVGFSGTISVVANPNGGGPGVPLSAWSNDNLESTGSTQTCQLQEYLDTKTSSFYTYQNTKPDGSGSTFTLCQSCTCPSAAGTFLTNSTYENIDILDFDGNKGQPDTTNFPSDVFEYLFGVPEAEWESIRDQAQIITSGTALNANSSGLYWHVGDIALGGTPVGSVAQPVILVVQDGGVKMNANDPFFGVLFIFQTPEWTGGAFDVALNGGPTFYGSIITNADVDLGNGSYTARYSSEVLDNLVNNRPSKASALAGIPGTWTNYLPQP